MGVAREKFDIIKEILHSQDKFAAPARQRCHGFRSISIELLPVIATNSRRLLTKECCNDQVELILTFEEFCAEEGEFNGDGGRAFATIFPMVIP